MNLSTVRMLVRSSPCAAGFWIDLVRCCLIFSLLVSLQTASAQLPTAELTGLSRQAAKVGATAEVTLSGSRLEELSQVLITDMSGQAVGLKASLKPAPAQPMRDEVETTGTVELTVDAGIAPGLVELRSVGRFGVSNPRCLLLTDLAVDVPTGDHSNLATAYSLKSEHLVNEKLPSRASHFYKLQVPGGSTLRCVAYAKQLDSMADLVLRLLSSTGAPLASSNSNGMWPSETAWTNSTAAPVDVYLEFRDLLYRGGDSFHFVLQWRVDAVQSDSAKQPMHLDDLLRPTIELPLKPSKHNQPIGPAAIARAWSDVVELPSKPIEQLPIRIKSDLNENRTLQFTAQKGQVLSFELHSAGLDQLTDPALVVYKVNPPPKPDAAPQLQQVAEQDDAPSLGTPAVKVRQLDPKLLWTAPDAATYQLSIIDRQSGNRPTDSRGFLLEIRPAQPSFAIIAHQVFPTNNPATARPWGSQLTRNGTTQVHVTVIRYDGFASSIELSAEGLPAGAKCSNVIVPAGVNEADMIIQAGAELESSIANVAIVGSAKNGEQQMMARSTFATISSAAIPTYNTVSSRRSGSLGLQLSNLDMAPLQVQLGDGNPLEVKAGAKFNLPVKLNRQTGSAAECTLRPQSLPPKIALGEFKIAPDKAEASPEINVPADAAPGEYTFWIQTETKVKWRANPQALAREEAYQAKLKSALEANSTGDVPKAQVEAAAAKSAARIEELKKQTAEAEYTLFLPSNPIRLRILPKD